MIKNIPQIEIQAFRDGVLQAPDLLDVSYVITQYKNYAQRVIVNPFDDQIISIIIKAVKDKKPFSLVRYGDGEINLLTFTKYSMTPTLNYIVAKEIVSTREHSFLVNPTSLFMLEQLMMAALDNADVIGVVGMWRPKEIPAKQFLTNMNAIRGMSGQWRGVDFMLKLAHKDSFKNKTIVSAHCYFSVINNLSNLLNTVDRVLLITSQLSAFEHLKSLYKNLDFSIIHLKKSIRPLKFKQPIFLYETYSQLPDDLSGVLVLIGSGPWAELYCHWVKQKGGVAIDIGSGFDLISGKKTRPVHRHIHQYNIKHNNNY